MDYGTVKLIATIVSWLCFPLLGAIVGVFIGMIYRKAGIRITRGPRFFLPVEVGALIGFGIALGGMLMSNVLNPAFWEGTNWTSLMIKEFVGFGLYLFLINKISVAIANKTTEDNTAAI